MIALLMTTLSVIFVLLILAAVCLCALLPIAFAQDLKENLETQNPHT